MSKIEPSPTPICGGATVTTGVPVGQLHCAKDGEPRPADESRTMSILDFIAW
jgi:hypothetical protein